MGGREREGMQLEPPGTKRPWDDGRPLSGQGRTWNEAPLPPISSNRPPLAHGGEANNDRRANYPQESMGPETKRPRYTRNEYHSPHGESFSMNSQMPHSQVTHPTYNANHINHGPILSPRPAPNQRPEGWENNGGGPARHMETRESSNLCRRCRKVLAGHPDTGLVECNDSHAAILRATADDLARLLGTLDYGIPCEERYRRGIPSLSPSRPKTAEEEYPPAEQFGLEHSLSWMLSRVRYISSVADRLVQEIPSDMFQRFKNERPQDSLQPRVGQPNTIKRDLDTDRDSEFRLRVDPSDPGFDDKRYTREAPSYPTQSPDGPHDRLSAMNPPLAATRQLPSPPGRSVSSPTSVNFPSPSAASFGSTSQPVPIPPPPGPSQTSPNIYLPPISSGRPSDSALQAHSAALQHDVSVQKIALSSLQAEHDKLLAAYLRSQTRASALEKKHSVSDTEIITLTEEKLRLQTQVLDLERDVEDISRSRDQARQSAVQEGIQYVEIVKKASQLEAMAVEEQKRWNTSKKELELRIEELKSGREDCPEFTESTNLVSLQKPLDKLKVEEPGVQEVGADATKPEAPDERKDAMGALEEEIQNLRRRCAEMEKALHIVREESRSIDGLTEALGRTIKSVLEHADTALQQRTED